MRFVERLQERVVTHLSTMPRAGASLGRFRFLVFRGYVTIYSVDEKAGVVAVLMVSEGHRNWREIVSAWE